MILCKLLLLLPNLHVAFLFFGNADPFERLFWPLVKSTFFAHIFLSRDTNLKSDSEQLHHAPIFRLFTLLIALYCLPRYSFKSWHKWSEGNVKKKIVL